LRASPRPTNPLLTPLPADAQDEFLLSFGRGVSQPYGDPFAGDAEAAAAAACGDGQAERALFEARENTVLNVERVREMASQLP
jgi:hypothetical protein